LRRILFAVPVLAVMAALPAEAEMFGPRFQPCGDKPSTPAVVECVQAKTNAADQRLNAAYKALQARIEANQRQSLLSAQRLWVQYPRRQLRLLRNPGRVNPAGAGSRMHTLNDGRPGS
jgi:uncharacterized protein YecT (DUF1311 family)